MFGKKIRYIKDSIGKIVGVEVGKNKFRIEKYSLMVNKPSYYLYDSHGTKVTNVDSMQELDMLIRNNF